MDLPLVNRALRFSKRRKKLLVFLAVCGVSGYGVYKVYHLPTVASKRKRLMKLFGAMVSVAELVSDSAETIGTVSRDLKEFLQSNSNELPNSLNQISKIVQSREFVQSVASVSEGFTVGVLRGYRCGFGDQTEIGNGSSDSNFTDRAMDRIFSTAGTGFVSAVVGSFARNLVLGFYSDHGSVEGSGSNRQGNLNQRGMSSLDVPGWVNALYNDKSKELLADCIHKFVSAAVTVYLNKTMDINTYDEFFVGLTNPKHKDEVRDIIVSICNGAVETLVKTSHQVLTGSSSTSSFQIIDEETKFSTQTLSKRSTANGIENGGWFDAVKTTLAVPSNRKFVFDVTGRVTFETLRSMVEFLSWKMLDSFKRSSRALCNDVVDRGREVVTFVGAKSYVIVTVCLAIYLHVFNSNRVLLPAY